MRNSSRPSKALQAAEDAGAPQYAPEAWNRAKEAADRMKAELEAQSKRFALFRNYGKVRTLAEQAARLSEQALAEANSRKTQLRGEVTAMIAELNASLESARSQLSRVPRSKGLDAASLRSSLNAAGRQLDQARSNLARRGPGQRHGRRGAGPRRDQRGAQGDRESHGDTGIQEAIGACSGASCGPAPSPGKRAA